MFCNFLNQCLIGDVWVIFSVSILKTRLPCISLNLQPYRHPEDKFLKEEFLGNNCTVFQAFKTCFSFNLLTICHGRRDSLLSLVQVFVFLLCLMFTRRSAPRWRVSSALLTLYLLFPEECLTRGRSSTIC